MMGRVAAELADAVIITDDNPRTEDPARIVADILAGMPTTGGKAGAAGQARKEGAAGDVGKEGAAGEAILIEHDRARAIQSALRRSIAGDVVLVAGKGHEDYQIYGTVRRPFKDQAVVSTELQGRKP